MEQFNVKNVNFDHKIDIIEKVMTNMNAKHSGLSRAGIMLSGEPGVGKTAFIKDLAGIFGLELIVMETPHLVEEHIVKIPFLVFDDPNNDSPKKDVIDVDVDVTKSYEVVFAKSNLHTTITNAKKLSDSKLLSHIKKEAQDDRKMIWEQMGGSPTVIPEDIAEIRSKYDSILFLDEFFRQTSTSIRNMLRSILNGRLGDDHLPDNVYIIYATNLNDEGVGEALDNEEFGKLIEFAAPNTEEWFAWLVSKMKKNTKVSVNDDVIEAFHSILTDEKLNHRGASGQASVSPRRWEQIITYVNASVPCKSKKEAAELLRNISVNFRHYITGENSELADEVLETVSKIIKDTSNIDISKHEATPHDDWRSTVRHQIETAIKIGDSRKYIPTIAGAPGIGKTQHVYKTIVKDLNMVPVIIDVQNLSAEETIGLTVPETGKNKKDISVGFSTAPLYKSMMHQISVGEKQLEERWMKLASSGEITREQAREKIREYQKKEYKYVIFFDELNRTKPKVLNAIRKILLEREFSDGKKLPKGSVIISAINPNSSSGTIELSKHMQDVLDIIPAGISWSSFKKEVLTPEANKLKKVVKNDELVPISENVLSAFASKFKAKEMSDETSSKEFHLHLGTGTSVYVSPRRYNELFNTSTLEVDRVTTKIMKTFESNDKIDYVKENNKIKEKMFESYKEWVHSIVKINHATDVPQFTSDLHEWFLHSDDVNFNLFKKVSKNILGLESILEPIVKDPTKHLFEDQEFINYIKTVEEPTFRDDLTHFLETLAKDDKKVFHDQLPQKFIDKDGKVTKKGTVSKFEFIIRELLSALEVNKINPQFAKVIKRAVSRLSTHLKTIGVDFSDNSHGFTKLLLDKKFGTDTYLSGE